MLCALVASMAAGVALAPAAGAQTPQSSDATLFSLSIESDIAQTRMFPAFDPAVERYDVAVPSGETEVTVKVKTNDPGASAVLESTRSGRCCIEELDYDANTDAYTLGLRTDRYTYMTIKVTAANGTEKQYDMRIDVASRDEKGWRVYNDVPMDRLVDEPQFPSHYIRGLWADDSRVLTTARRHGTKDGEVDLDQKLYAFDAADSSRLPDEEFVLSGRPHAGIWSDGTTLWALDTDGTLRAYDLSDGSEITGWSVDLSPDGYYDTREVYEPRGIWSDGDTLWVTGKDDADNAKGFAFELPKGCNSCRKSSLDFELSGDNDNPWGITGNADTWWVTEVGEGGWTADTRTIYAYNRSDGTRDTDKDIDLSELTTTHLQQLYYGLAATDTIMYVAEYITNRVHSFNMPGVTGPVAPALTSSDATLSGLELKVHPVDPVDPTIVPLDPPFTDPIHTVYSAQVEPEVGSVLVVAEPNDISATVRINGTIAPKVDGTNTRSGVVSLGAEGADTRITVDVTAQDDTTTKEYTVEVDRPAKSTDATLDMLDLSSVTLVPVFLSATETYTASVANGVVFTAVSATPNDSAASFVIQLGGVTDDDGVVDLDVGANEITVVVTAEDGQTAKTYEVTVTRAEPPPNTDATLDMLDLTDVTLVPVFLSATETYTASVANGVVFTAVSATPNDSAASFVIQLGGVTDDDGVVDLDVGANEITVVVTAEDGQTAKTYEVTVTRAEPPPNTDATLDMLDLSSVALVPVFLSATETYTASVANGVVFTTVSATPNDSAASFVIQLGGVTDDDGVVPLDVGANEITVVVTAEDGQTTKTYEVTVTRDAPPPSNDAMLANLELSNAELVPVFLSATETYTASVANGVTSTTVTATANDADANLEITLDTTVAESNAMVDLTVDLAVGENEITVVVTAEDGQTAKTYEVTVTRAEPPPNTDATLDMLELSSVTLVPVFLSATETYTASVANGVVFTAVSATPNDSAASFVIQLGGVTDDDGVVPLDVGANEITVVVTAEDGQTAKTYEVTVTRAEPPPNTDATLDMLELSSVALVPVFLSATETYTASVANGVESTTVSATPNDSAASFVIQLGGVTDDDGVVPLDVGANEITVVVTAADDTTTKTYTVTVNRAASGSQPPVNSNPGTYNPGTYNPGTYNPGTYNPGTYNPGTYNPGTYNPGGGSSNTGSSTVGESSGDAADSDSEADDFTPLDDAGDAGTDTEAAINALHRLGVFTGTLCQSNRLCPNDPLQRWIAAVWLVRLIDGDDPAAVTESRFEDVNASSMWEESVWYAPHVERLADLEITVGCTQDPLNFCPDVNLSRAQVASWLARAFDLESDESQGFVDAVGSVHEANINAVVAAGVMSGCSTSPKNFCLTDTVTKGEMARYVYAARNVSLGLS